MYKDNKRLHRICFTGHRPEKLIRNGENIKEIEIAIKTLLYDTIDKCITKGYTTYISGMSRGFDMWAADIVIEKKKINPNIKLICAISFNGFEKRWELAEKIHYYNILKKSDYIKIVSNCYSKECFQKRNIYMVDNSHKVIAAFNGTKGGTLNTINYAKSKNIEIINILT